MWMFVTILFVVDFSCVVCLQASNALLCLPGIVLVALGCDWQNACILWLLIHSELGMPFFPAWGHYSCGPSTWYTESIWDNVVETHPPSVTAFWSSFTFHLSRVWLTLPWTCELDYHLDWNHLWVPDCTQSLEDKTEDALLMWMLTSVSASPSLETVLRG